MPVYYEEFVLPTSYEDEVAVGVARRCLRQTLLERETLIYRAPFRWLRDCGAHAHPKVLNSHFESASLRSLAAEFGHDVIVDFGDIAIVHLYKWSGR